MCRSECYLSQLKFTDGPLVPATKGAMRAKPTTMVVNERDFLQQAKDLARLCGWRCYHTLDSRGSDAGFPDLVLVRHGRLIFAELKSETGKATPLQRGWLIDLARAGAQVYLSRPARWAQIEATLRGF